MPGQRGPPGENTYGTQGPVGEPGKMGQQGSPGENGQIGAQGNPGPGTVGAQGAKGENGPDGAQGSQGSPGKIGMQGAQGNPGTDGSKGAQGVPGISYPGNPGAQGVQGNPGQNGNPGNQGVQGAQGNPGAVGDNGAQGAQGNPGNIGSVGQQGAVGNPGNQGPQGPYGFGATKYIYGEVVGPTVFNDSINETPPNYITLQSDGTQTRTYGILIVQIAGTVVNFPEPFPVTAQFNIYVSSDLLTLFSAEMIVPITPTAVVSSITQYRVLASQSFYMILPPTGTPFNIYITIANSYMFGFPSLELSAITGTDWFNAILLHY